MAPENHKAGANKRHGEGADVSLDASGPNDQRAVTRDHVNRFRRTLGALGAEDDDGFSRRGVRFG